jgi:hypothetical protein
MNGKMSILTRFSSASWSQTGVLFMAVVEQEDNTTRLVRRMIKLLICRLKVYLIISMDSGGTIGVFTKVPWVCLLAITLRCN